MDSCLKVETTALQSVMTVAGTCASSALHLMLSRKPYIYAFEELALNRIHAKHFGSNPASGRVMRKVGMSLEGVRPEHYKKWETYEDRVDYGLLVRDWRKNKRG